MAEVTPRIAKLRRKRAKAILEARVVRAAIAWFSELKPLAWTDEKHVHNPRCNTTSDAAERLAVAAAEYLRCVDRKGHP